MFISRKTALVLLTALFTATWPCFGETYKLRPGDKVSIFVYQWDALNHVYTVDPSGNISLPIIGSVSVSGEETDKIGAAISQLLATKMKLAVVPTTSIEIVQFSSFSVLGDVEKPGDYVYRPGMIVLNALALAGGYYRLPVSRDAFLTKGKLDDDAAKLKRLYAQKARLQAAADGKTTLDPQQVSDGLGHPGVDSDLLKQEAAILASQQAGISSQTLALDKDVDLLGQEIVKRQAQVEAIKDELRGLTSEASNVRDLLNKGMSTTSRETSMAVTIADVKRTQFEIETSIIHAQQDIKSTRQKKDSLLFDFHTKNLLELSDVEGRIEGLKFEIETLLQSLGSSVLPAGGKASVTIVRRGVQGLTETPAQELDSIEPGDILRFERKSTQRIGGGPDGTNYLSFDGRQ